MSSNQISEDGKRESREQAAAAGLRASSRRRTVVTTMTGSAAVTVIVALQALVLAPLFVRELGTPLYGAWLATGELLVWLQAFDLGLPNLLIQRIGAAHGRNDAATVGEYLASGLLVLSVIGLLLAGAAVALSPWVPALMGLAGKDAKALGPALAVAGVATAATLPINAVVGFSRGIQQTGLMSAATVVSVLAGFGVTLGLLLSGWGVSAAALGIAVRSIVLMAGAGLFVASHLSSGLVEHFRVRRRVWNEVWSISPVTALGGLAYAGMNQSETALVAILGRPDLAAAYALSRRAADLGRILIDMIGTATYGSFAHLVASKDRWRSLDVHAQITSLRLSLAVAAAGAYVAVNASLVGAWVGPELYVGLPLTIAFAVQMIVVGQGYLLNYLYRATGAVATGSSMLVGEAIIRVPLMVLLFRGLGVFGIPLAGILTAGGFGALAQRWTFRELADAVPAPRSFRLRVDAARVLVILAGVAIGAVLQQPSWMWSVSVSVVFAGLTVVLLAGLDPMLGSSFWSLGSALSTRPSRLFSR